jgi:hypothetical protein
MRRTVLTLAATLLTAGCATLSEDECRVADWRVIGLADGERGRGPGFVAQHASACAEIAVVPDAEAWERGRQDGLRAYCTPANAYALAARGGGLNPVCGGFEPGPLAAADAEGREVWRAEQRLRRIERAIHTREQRIRRLAPLAEKDRGAEQEIRRLRRDIRFLELEALTAGGYGRPSFGLRRW